MVSVLPMTKAKEALDLGRRKKIQVATGNLNTAFIPKGVWEVTLHSS